MAATRDPETDPIYGELYLAGDRVPAGMYRQVGTHREVCLDEEDHLPGSLDGRVACYEVVLPGFFTQAVVKTPADRTIESEEGSEEERLCSQPF